MQVKQQVGKLWTGAAAGSNSVFSTITSAGGGLGNILKVQVLTVSAVTAGPGGGGGTNNQANGSEYGGGTGKAQMADTVQVQVLHILKQVEEAEVQVKEQFT